MWSRHAVLLFVVSQICTRSMAQVECLSAMMVGMKSRRDQIALAAEALYKMFDKGEEELVSQVNQHLHAKAEIATQFVQYVFVCP